MHGATGRLARAGAASPGVAQSLQTGTGFCSQGPPEFLFRLPDAGPWRLYVLYADGSSGSMTAVTGGTMQAPPGRRGGESGRTPTPELHE